MGLQTQAFQITVPFTLDPQVVMFGILIVIIGTVVGISSYQTTKAVKKYYDRKKQEVLDMFSDMYKDALRAWNKSTSMTGAAIEMLLKEGDLGAIGESQSLPSSAYDKMSAKLIQAGFRS